MLMLPTPPAPRLAQHRRPAQIDYDFVTRDVARHVLAGVSRYALRARERLSQRVRHVPVDEYLREGERERERCRPKLGCDAPGGRPVPPKAPPVGTVRRSSLFEELGF